MRIGDLTPDLTLDEHGIWRSAGSSSISYPDEVREILLEIEDKSFWFQHRNDCIAVARKR